MSVVQREPDFLRGLRPVFTAVSACVLLSLGTFFYCFYLSVNGGPVPRSALVTTAPEKPSITGVWIAPDSTRIPLTAEGDLIRYGKELIAHTSRYLGPGGTVRPSSNGMNCQNCHLKSGTKPFGNNYGAVASTYPKFRARSGLVETIEKRINDCIERSLNGMPLAEGSREVRAIIAYFEWLGQNVEKGKAPLGSGLISLKPLSRAADPAKGRAVYVKHCQTCHGENAEGYKHPDSLEWKYPPLAGPHSYNTGAGLFRLSRFAGYVKSNMPNGTSYEDPVLTDEEAWDVAAYINSLERPKKVFAADWPDISKKPFDHPFGPYADTFPESQHKYGPFAPILAAKQ